MLRKNDNEEEGMKKNTAIVLIIVLLVLSVFFIYNRNSRNTTSQNNKIKTNIAQNIKPEISIPTEESSADKKQSCAKNTLYIVQPNGSIKKAEEKIDGDDIYLAIINASFSIYKIDKYKNIIEIPEAVKMNSSKIYNGTLIVDFSKEIKNIKFKNVGYEESFIKALVLSLKSSSDKFQDVQFTIDGNKETYIFGNIPTNNPIRYDIDNK